MVYTSQAFVRVPSVGPFFITAVGSDIFYCQGGPTYPRETNLSSKSLPDDYLHRKIKRTAPFGQVELLLKRSCAGDAQIITGRFLLAYILPNVRPEQFLVT